MEHVYDPRIDVGAHRLKGRPDVRRNGLIDADNRLPYERPGRKEGTREYDGNSGNRQFLSLPPARLCRLYPGLGPTARTEDCCCATLETAQTVQRDSLDGLMRFRSHLGPWSLGGLLDNDLDRF